MSGFKVFQDCESMKCEAALTILQTFEIRSFSAFPFCFIFCFIFCSVTEILPACNMDFSASHLRNICKLPLLFSS